MLKALKGCRRIKGHYEDEFFSSALPLHFSSVLRMGFGDVFVFLSETTLFATLFIVVPVLEWTLVAFTKKKKKLVLLNACDPPTFL